MRVAVVTPYCREPEPVLRRCHASVAAQTHPCTHFMIADGHPVPAIAGWPVEHLVLARAHGDFGNTPRGLGALLAASEGFEAIALLDADNWYGADHVARMVALQRQSGAAICTAARNLHRPDGSLLGPDQESDGEGFADTSCMFFHATSFEVLPLWCRMPAALGPIGDRIVWAAIQARGLRRAHSGEPTVAFTTRYAAAYRRRGEAPPEGAKEHAVSVQPGYDLWRTLTPSAKAALLLDGAAPASLSSALDHLVTRPRTPRPVTIPLPITYRDGETLTLESPREGNAAETVRRIFRRKVYPALPKGEVATVLDIGAGAGFASAYFRFRYPGARIVAVEPDPVAHRILAANLRVIGNAEGFNLALRAASGFERVELGESLGLNIVGDAAGKVSWGAVVRAVEVGEFIAGIAISSDGAGSPDIVKLDARGHEVGVLLRLKDSLGAIKAIHVELGSESERLLLDLVLAETHTLIHTAIGETSDQRRRDARGGTFTYFAKRLAG